MKTTGIFTKTSELYWHFHPIGTGIICTYSVKTMKMTMTCEHTGEIIESFYVNQEELTFEEFKKMSIGFFREAIDKGDTNNLEYMDDPTIVGCIGVDFDLLKN